VKSSLVVTWTLFREGNISFVSRKCIYFLLYILTCFTIQFFCLTDLVKTRKFMATVFLLLLLSYKGKWYFLLNELFVSPCCIKKRNVPVIIGWALYEVKPVHQEGSLCHPVAFAILSSSTGAIEKQLFLHFDFSLSTYQVSTPPSHTPGVVMKNSQPFHILHWFVLDHAHCEGNIFSFWKYFFFSLTRRFFFFMIPKWIELWN
jgi:hypothetical protein